MTRATLLCLLSTAAVSQTAALSQSGPAFDIANVHVSPRAEWAKTVRLPMQGGYLAGDRYELRRATLLDMIRTAYGVDADKVYGGPSWLDYDRFEVAAKTKPGTRPEALKLMLQALLADRFHLTIKPETRQVPAFILTKGKRDLKLKASTDAAVPPLCQPAFRVVNGTPTSQLQCHNATMDVFARALRRLASPPAGTIPVVDSTGLEGGWDFDLAYGSEGSLFDSIDSLGLKLERGQSPQPVLSVVSVNEQPSANPPGIEKSLPPRPAPEFEVASLKWPCDGTGNLTINPRFEAGGRVTATCVPLLGLIRLAWGLASFEDPVGIPKWLADDHTTKYNVSLVAKAPLDVSPDAADATMARDTLYAMLRNLLIDRYKMRVHYEDRPMDAHTLVAVKPKLTKADPANRTGCVRQNQGQPVQGRSLIVKVTCQNMTLAQFAEQIPAYDIEIAYPVLDATEIGGAWDFTITYDAMAGITARFPTSSTTPDGQAADPSGSVSFAGALEKQLGLKLEVHKRPVPVLVIDSMEEKPADN